MNEDITWEYLVSVLEYNPDTGIFTWIKNTSLKNLIGKPAGALNSNGYINMSVGGKKYSAHRLAWFYCFKEWPVYNIDHIDGNRSNNSLDNLRDVTQSLNIRNAKCALPKSGVTGVVQSGTGWKASSELNGKYVYLGTYKTKLEASEAFIHYKNKQYEDFIHS